LVICFSGGWVIGGVETRITRLWPFIHYSLSTDHYPLSSHSIHTFTNVVNECMEIARAFELTRLPATVCDTGVCSRDSPSHGWQERAAVAVKSWHIRGWENPPAERLLANCKRGAKIISAGGRIWPTRQRHVVSEREKGREKGASPIYVNSQEHEIRCPLVSTVSCSPPAKQLPNTALKLDTPPLTLRRWSERLEANEQLRGRPSPVSRIPLGGAGRRTYAR
jgi:hypothetical protein